jgi:hypothetical protein
MQDIRTNGGRIMIQEVEDFAKIVNGTPGADEAQDDTPLIRKLRMLAVMAAPFLLVFAFVCFVYAATTDLYTSNAAVDLLMAIAAMLFAQVMLQATWRAKQLWDELQED